MNRISLSPRSAPQFGARIANVWRAFRRDRRGAAAVEFVFAIPIFIALLIGVVEFSRILVVRSSMQFAVEETTRHAMVHGDATDETLMDMVRQKIATSDSEQIIVAVTTETVSSVKYLKITASYSVPMITGFFGSEPFTLTSSSRVPVTN